MGKCINVFILITIILGLLVLTAFFIVFTVSLIYIKDNYEEILSGITGVFSPNSVKDQVIEMSQKLDRMIILLENKT
jgi:hypothetical protein